ncbi:Uncharacterised protein [Cedecea neteri]|uniref:Uncharacterized protein n=1 Tax=Cedecea neteri TaxID=158822 RepID=A0A2X3IYJ2_9ENTR|nr:Uncharacterised protein [Cedecea neteri]
MVFDKAAAPRINAIILPVPTATTKGVLLCRTIFGNMILGPTAEEQQDRNRAEVDEAVMKGLIEKGRQMLPELTNYSRDGDLCRLTPRNREKRVPHSSLSGTSLDNRGRDPLHRPDRRAGYRIMG